MMTVCDTTSSEVQDQTMWEKYQQTHETDARNRLVERYLPLVQILARKIKATLPPSVEPGDLENAGVIGLMAAIDKFDMSHGTKFETFCSRRIHGAMIDHLRDWDFMPRMKRLRLHKYERTLRRLTESLGRKPTLPEIAEDMDVSLKIARSVHRDRRLAIVSLDSCMDNEDDKGQGRLKVWEDKKGTSPLEYLQKQEVREVIENTLSRTQRLVVMLYYYEKLTMREVGEALDISEARVCQIHGEIKESLRKRLAVS